MIRLNFHVSVSALPDAITDYLRAYVKRHAPERVLLIGDRTYATQLGQMLTTHATTLVASDETNYAQILPTMIDSVSLS